MKEELGVKEEHGVQALAWQYIPCPTHNQAKV